MPDIPDSARQPLLFSYVILRDFGFAPNPFHSICTLATCKPNVRSSVSVGDWVIGTGSKQVSRDGRLVCAMRVDELVTFDDYWADPRFQSKRPRVNGSLVQVFGDNIYHHDPNTGAWIQEDSHHSLHDGSPNSDNLGRDTQSDAVLVSRHFAYFGADAPEIPGVLRDFQGADICKTGPGQKSRFARPHVDAMLAWVESLGMDGCLGDPYDWRHIHRNRQLKLW